MFGYEVSDFERYVPNEEHSSSRSDFERDRARILHSSSLRRLGTKTQVLGADFDDFVRTRLTHTLEVAQIGRTIAKKVGCSEDIVDAACLAHDIGHPPFGHNGELALNEVAKDIGGFEGNAQTFRLLTRLEPKIFAADGRSAGLNLTRAVLDATIKYPWTFGDAKEHRTPDRTLKYSVYEDDTEIYDWVRIKTPENMKYNKCIEAQIMDLADDISYCVHDIEDALVSGAFTGESLAVLREKSNQQLVFDAIHDWFGTEFEDDELSSAIGRLESIGVLDIEFTGSRSSYAALKNMTSTLIGRFATKTENSIVFEGDSDLRTRYHLNLRLDKQMRAEIQILKGFSVVFVMSARDAMSLSKLQREVIYDLAEFFMRGNGLDKMFEDDFKNSTSDYHKLRVVIDQIACLTDFSASKIAKSLIGVV
ncbi:MAG: deoxyguanosinetriphosphate triphosphohydrolase [Candidatus Ancillula sp.]|jgi:dGTPase|nr:deoxyguanosinetriphosphate triphosphohydrolase [Candidatus Ancillula sp.]